MDEFTKFRMLKAIVSNSNIAEGIAINDFRDNVDSLRQSQLLEDTSWKNSPFSANYPYDSLYLSAKGFSELKYLLKKYGW